MSLPRLDSSEKSNDSKGKLPSAPRLPTMPTIDSEPQVPNASKSENDYSRPSEQDTYDEQDVFEEVDVRDVLSEDDVEINEDIYNEAREIHVQPEVPVMNNEERIELEDNYNPDFEEDLEVQDESKYIDKKRKKLIPLGGGRSRRKVKSSEFDERKNTLGKTKIIRSIVMLIILILFGLGLKNTFLPSHVYTDEQIRQFAAEGAGQTGFPDERGQAFVESFMNSYLTIDRNNPALTEQVSHYYGIDSSGEIGEDNLNMKIGWETTQTIITPPKIYEKTLWTDYSAQYKVSAFVSDTDGTVNTENGSAGRWLSFAVNVYYDEVNDTLAITEDSPTVIPPYRIENQSNIPERMPFGNGTINEDIAPAINPTINGFVIAYAESSVNSHETILQYITDKKDQSLVDGFGGTVELSGEPSDSIRRTIYNGDDNIYRVVLSVDWVDKVSSGGDSKIEYTGRYIMRVNDEGEGKYSVSSFVPYNYFTENN